MHIWPNAYLYVIVREKEKLKFIYKNKYPQRSETKE